MCRRRCSLICGEAQRIAVLSDLREMCSSEPSQVMPEVNHQSAATKIKRALPAAKIRPSVSPCATIQSCAGSGSARGTGAITLNISDLVLSLFLRYPATLCKIRQCTAALVPSPRRDGMAARRPWQSGPAARCRGRRRCGGPRTRSHPEKTARVSTSRSSHEGVCWERARPC